MVVTDHLDNFANRGRLRANAYDNPVPSFERGRSNDYRFVTEYIAYLYGNGSACQLIKVNVLIVAFNSYNCYN